MEKRPSWQLVVFAFLIIASIPFLSQYSSKAGYLAEDYFSSYVYKIGNVGWPTGFSLQLFCEIAALLVSITIIVVIFLPYYSEHKMTEQPKFKPIIIAFCCHW